jgi:hypothetical protein
VYGERGAGGESAHFKSLSVYGEGFREGFMDRFLANYSKVFLERNFMSSKLWRIAAYLTFASLLLSLLYSAAQLVRALAGSA